jgi:hypothetical protein
VDHNPPGPPRVRQYMSLILIKAFWHGNVILSATIAGIGTCVAPHRLRSNNLLVKFLPGCHVNNFSRSNVVHSSRCGITLCSPCSKDKGWRKMTSRLMCNVFLFKEVWSHKDLVILIYCLWLFAKRKISQKSSTFVHKIGTSHFVSTLFSSGWHTGHFFGVLR